MIKCVFYLVFEFENYIFCVPSHTEFLFLFSIVKKYTILFLFLRREDLSQLDIF